MALDLSRVLPAEDPEGLPSELDGWIQDKLNLLMRRSQIATILLAESDHPAMAALKADTLAALKEKDGDAQFDCESRLLALDKIVEVTPQKERETPDEIGWAENLFLFGYSSRLTYEELLLGASVDNIMTPMEILRETHRNIRKKKSSGFVRRAEQTWHAIVKALGLRYTVSVREGIDETLENIRGFKREFLRKRPNRD